MRDIWHPRLHIPSRLLCPGQLFLLRLLPHSGPSVFNTWAATCYLWWGMFWRSRFKTSSFCHPSSTNQLKHNLEAGHFTNFGHQKNSNIWLYFSAESLAFLSSQFKSWGRKRAPGSEDKSEMVMRGRGLGEDTGTSWPAFSGAEGKLILEVRIAQVHSLTGRPLTCRNWQWRATEHTSVPEREFVILTVIKIFQVRSSSLSLSPHFFSNLTKSLFSIPKKLYSAETFGVNSDFPNWRLGTHRMFVLNH